MLYRKFLFLSKPEKLKKKIQKYTVHKLDKNNILIKYHQKIMK